MSFSSLRPHLFAALAAVALLTACVGGGGGGGGVVLVPATPPRETALGARGMPDGEVSLSLLTPAAAGAETVVAIDVPSTYPAVAQVEVGVATEAGMVTVLSAATVPVAPGRYQVAVTMPTPLPTGRRMFVRLVHGDGAVVESGVDDFRMP